MPKQLSDLVPDQEPRKLASGFQFTEGPVWIPDGYLLFSDIPDNRIVKYTPDGAVDTYLAPSQNSNGLTLDLQGRLVACEHTGRRVSRQDPNGQMETLASHWEGKRLNSPNDVVVHSSGRIFFTDPTYGIEPEQAEIEFSGVYRIDTDNTITLLASDFVGPNGLAFSPDESVLYVDDSERENLRAFDLQEDFSLGNDRVFMEMAVDAPGGPDGMKVDTEGNVYITGGGGIWVITPEGEHIGTIAFPEIPANLAFGGDDYKTLYATAETGLYSVQINVAGIRPGQ